MPRTRQCRRTPCASYLVRCRWHTQHTPGRWCCCRPARRCRAPFTPSSCGMHRCWWCLCMYLQDSWCRRGCSTPWVQRLPTFPGNTLSSWCSHGRSTEWALGSRTGRQHSLSRRYMRRHLESRRTCRPDSWYSYDPKTWSRPPALAGRVDTVPLARTDSR